MKTTVRLDASSLSALSDGELDYLLARVWNRDRAADRAVLDALAARGVDPPSLTILLLACTLERGEREAKGGGPR